MENTQHSNHLAKIKSSPYLKKGLKIFRILFIVLVLLLLLVWGGLSWYVKSNKGKLLDLIQTNASEKFQGNVVIGDLELGMWNNFPNITIRLKDISISDSLIELHNRKLLEAKDVFVSIQPFSLISGNPNIKKVTVANASIHIFTDSTGYSNTYVLKSKKEKEKKKSKNVNINQFGFKNVKFVFDYFGRRKQFSVDINELKGNVVAQDEAMLIKANIDAFVHQLGFNIERGGFLKNKRVRTRLRLAFNNKEKFLKIERDKVLVDKDIEVFFGALFNFQPDNKSYHVEIDAPGIDFSTGRSMLSRHIASKLDSINVARPVKVHTDINGIMRYPDTPHVIVTFSSQKNIVVTPLGELTNANFTGRFDNEFEKGQGKGDDNSTIYIDKLQADWWQIPVIVDSSMIVGLKQPILKCQIRSKFPVEKLNELAGSSFLLRQGLAELKINYTGPLIKEDTSGHSMVGFIKIKNAHLKYVPRSLNFEQCNADIHFTGSDLILENVSLNTKNSNVQMKGTARQFMNAYFRNQGKAVFDWTINSSHVDLNDFKAFIAQRKHAENQSSAPKIRKINSQIDKILKESDMHLDVNVRSIAYKKFTARNIDANISLLESGISIRHLKVNHADGHLSIKGLLKQSNAGNPFNFNADISKVNISKLFHAFDNFGFENLTSKNLKGTFSSKINLSGGMTEGGELIYRKFKGDVNIVIDKGALIDYKPIMQVQKFAFKKRNLQHITFERLTSSLDIDDGKIVIQPTEIASSAIYMKIQGVYGLEKGTDISIEAPLRNPEKDKGRSKPNRKKGLVLYLRAKDNNDGNVKISWDPLKKGIKENEYIEEEEEE